MSFVKNVKIPVFILYLASHDIFILKGSLLYEMMAVNQDNRTSLLSLATNPLSPPSLMPLGNAGANYSVPIYITIYDSYMTPATAQVGIIVSIMVRKMLRDHSLIMTWVGVGKLEGCHNFSGYSWRGETFF